MRGDTPCVLRSQILTFMINSLIMIGVIFSGCYTSHKIFFDESRWEINE